jgi:hypothetical protein
VLVRTAVFVQLLAITVVSEALSVSDLRWVSAAYARVPAVELLAAATAGRTVAIPPVRQPPPGELSAQSRCPRDIRKGTCREAPVRTSASNQRNP